MKNSVGKKHETSNTILAAYLAHLKGAVTRFAHQRLEEFGWQARYHDHLIRGIRDGNNISEYIKNNVMNWSVDCFYQQ